MEFLDRIAREWSVVSQAPFSFFYIAVAVSALAFLVTRWRYTSIIDQVRAKTKHLLNDCTLELNRLSFSENVYINLKKRFRQLLKQIHQYLSKRHLNFQQKFINSLSLIKNKSNSFGRKNGLSLKTLWTKTIRNSYGKNILML